MAFGTRDCESLQRLYLARKAYDCVLEDAMSNEPWSSHLRVFLAPVSLIVFFRHVGIAEMEARYLQDLLGADSTPRVRFIRRQHISPLF